MPDVILVRKSYEEKRRKRREKGLPERMWKLKHLDMDVSVCLSVIHVLPVLVPCPLPDCAWAWTRVAPPPSDRAQAHCLQAACLTFFASFAPALRWRTQQHQGVVPRQQLWPQRQRHGSASGSGSWR